ncbi:MAG TPA: acyl carrier protein [Polyangiaceae bacterium]|nr:acyl carrier protein [Polyangiaceae bacterium]
MSTDRAEILKRMTKVISEQLDADEATVAEKTSFVDDLGADSLAIVELVLAMEEAFGVAIPDDEAENLRTVGDAVDYVIANAGKKGTPKAKAS